MGELYFLMNDRGMYYRGQGLCTMTADVGCAKVMGMTEALSVAEAQFHKTRARLKPVSALDHVQGILEDRARGINELVALKHKIQQQVERPVIRETSGPVLETIFEQRSTVAQMRPGPLRDYLLDMIDRNT